MGCGQSTAKDVEVPSRRIPKQANKTTKGKTNAKNIQEPEAQKKPKATYANYCSSHNAQLQVETDCNLRGVTFLKNGDLVAADYKNNKLKLFSSKFDFLHDLELESAPWDVCEAVDCVNEILVTVPYKKEVARVSITTVNNKQRLVVKECFRTEGFCWGITCFDGGIAVSVKVSVNPKAWPKPPEFQVHIHEYDGTFRRAITFNQDDGSAYFNEPKYLNVTYDDIFLLASDYKSNSVLCINNEDELIFSYTGMKSPNGITMDEGKNVHVTSFYGVQRVHKVGANGKYKDGLPHDEERPLFPHGICYRKQDRIIVLTTDRSLEVYKLV